MKETVKKLKSFGLSLLSRKFLVALVGAIVAFGNSYWDWGLKIEEVFAILTPLLAFIGIEGFVDAKREENR